MHALRAFVSNLPFVHELVESDDGSADPAMPEANRTGPQQDNLDVVYSSCQRKREENRQRR